MTIFTIDRERQRFEHLALERPRPRTEAPSATSRRKGRRRVSIRPAAPATPIVLAPGIEERVAMRERWSHKQGTPETHEHAFHARQRPGSIARLFESGAIDKDQLAAAEQIAETYRSITAHVSVRTASLEARIDGGMRDGAGLEHFGRVRAEMAYTAWRAAIGPCAAALLPVIVDDIGLTIVARRHRISMPRARRMLAGALDLWWTERARAGRTCTP